MSLARPGSCPVFRLLGAFSALVLLLGLVGGALHHHAREDASHACVTCSLSHAPATTTVPLEGAPTLQRHEQVAIPSLDSPRTICASTPSTRAPPADLIAAPA